ncbi:hypothetical protein [Ideonella sp. B508-1]|uniref:hypothetical protein n=1 Tax=Ideonella sp. B508-1 TaxID=137716 RepID=UPI0011D1E309|nr:hypothetical protein [Ideonella sp. B508-1]
MSSKRALYIYFALLVLIGITIGYSGARGMEPPKIINMLFMVFTTVSIYLWYYFDAKERSYQRSTLLGGAVLMFSVIAIPIYLLKSRESGKKVRSILNYISCLLLTLIIPVVTATSTSVLSAPAETLNPSIEASPIGKLAR